MITCWWTYRNYTGMVGRASGLECSHLPSTCSTAFFSLPSSSSLLPILISVLLHDLMDGGSPCMSFRLPWFLLPFLPPISLTASIQALGLLGSFLPYSSVMSLSWFIRRFTMRYPLHRLWHLCGATTTFCSSLPTFGFAFLSPSSLRYCLGISSKHGNSAFALMMSISSGILAKRTLTETSPAILKHVILWLS